MKRNTSKVLLAAAVFGLGFAAINSQAQHYYHNQSPVYGYNSYGAGGGCQIGQYVYALDQYGDQMTYLYSMEARGYCGCACAAALLAEMRRYNCHTNNLISAYHGSCPKTFKKRACCVRDSLTRIEQLRRRARVSRQVCALISQSCPLATYVHNNAHAFRPVSRPVYPSHGGSCAPSVTHHRHHNHRGGKIDVGSAILGAVAGRVIHGIVHGH